MAQLMVALMEQAIVLQMMQVIPLQYLLLNLAPALNWLLVLTIGLAVPIHQVFQELDCYTTQIVLRI